MDSKPASPVEAFATICIGLQFARRIVREMDYCTFVYRPDYQSLLVRPQLCHKTDLMLYPGAVTMGYTASPIPLWSLRAVRNEKRTQ